MLFAGDIMAHSENYSMSDYNNIWTDVKNLISEHDLAFANLEAPVDDDLPYSSYPKFNMKSAYVQAVINAGFDVFSLVNNHSIDQGLKGIISTRQWAENLESHSENKLYFSGIKETKEGNLSYKIIQKNGWKILFCAITEILNEYNLSGYLNFINYTENGRTNFKQLVEKINSDNNPDLFILSIHSNEPEYKFEINEKRKNYYHELLDSGVDIIWANHPHVVRERELLGEKETKRLSQLILYGNGNTISGQRRNPRFDLPQNARDNTGDGVLFSITFEKDIDGKVFITKSNPFYITTYINTNNEFVLKKLDDEFIQYLKDNNRLKWVNYISERKKITESTKESIIWR